MNLIITRHGETEENKKGIIQGHLPGHLSKTGWTQAEKVALRLKDTKIDYIYSSDLSRAANTAATIHKFHKSTPIEFVGELREIYLGEWQGKRKKDVSDFPDDAETYEQLFDRAKRFLSKIMDKHDTVLLVGHNGINKALISVITGKTFADIKTMENLHNTSINIFEIGKDKNHKVHVLNCKKHLD